VPEAVHRQSLDIDFIVLLPSCPKAGSCRGFGRLLPPPARPRAAAGGSWQ
jgi:hypothetical protein